MIGRRLLFIKPPKTGSTSATVAINRALAATELQSRGHHGFPHATPEPLPPDVAMLHGHVSWHEVEPWMADPAGWAPIMTLRDPLERTLSHYRYLRQRARRPAMPDSDRPLCEEALARPLRDLVRDETSRFHGWTMPVQTILLGADLNGLVTEHAWPAGVHDPAFHERALRVALARLEQLRWIGITESLWRDLETLAHLQGWPPLAEPRSNVTARPSGDDAAFCEADPDTRRLLQKRLLPDSILYESARELAAERRRAIGPASRRG
ncbi:MAG: hypothetical protein ACKOWF_16585 [Chloroflexota bacterium]